MRFREVEHNLSDTKVYFYTLAVLIWLSDLIKKGIKWFWYHIAELLIAISFIGMFIAIEAFDNGSINFTVAFLFLMILIALAVALVKIKILESRENKSE